MCRVQGAGRFGRTAGLAGWRSTDSGRCCRSGSGRTHQEPQRACRSATDTRCDGGGERQRTGMWRVWKFGRALRGSAQWRRHQEKATVKKEKQCSGRVRAARHSGAHSPTGLYQHPNTAGGPSAQGEGMHCGGGDEKESCRSTFAAVLTGRDHAGTGAAQQQCRGRGSCSPQKAWLQSWDFPEK